MQSHKASPAGPVWPDRRRASSRILRSVWSCLARAVVLVGLSASRMAAVSGAPAISVCNQRLGQVQAARCYRFVLGDLI